MLTLLHENFLTYWSWRNEQELDTCYYSDYMYTLRERHFWDHLTYLTALQRPCSPQTYNYVTTLTDQR